MEKNALFQLIKVIEGHFQRINELTIEIKTILNSAISSLISSSERNAQADVKLDNINDTIKDINNKIEIFSNFTKESVSNTLEKLIKEIMQETTKSGDKCSSPLCPKKEEVSELRSDKDDIIHLYEKKEKWWKKSVVVLGILVLIFAIGMILVSALGIEGLKMWFKDITLKSILR